MGVLQAVQELRMQGWEISDAELEAGLSQATQLSQLKGRWQVLQQTPMVVADVAHNDGGLKETLNQLHYYDYTGLRFVLGFVKDKDVAGVLGLFPKEATYYFCAADLPRSLPAIELQTVAATLGLLGETYPSVAEALNAAPVSYTHLDV